MSASEKLKALEHPEMRGVWDGIKVFNALPQIVAVVEAAERAPCEHDLQVGEWGTEQRLTSKPGALVLVAPPSLLLMRR